MADYDYDDSPRMAPPRRRPYVSISGYSVLRLAQTAIAAALFWGLVLADQWLWGLVHGH